MGPTNKGRGQEGRDGRKRREGDQKDYVGKDTL